MIYEQALPAFEYKDRAIRWQFVEHELYFIVNDIFYALRMNKGKKLRELSENEKTLIEMDTKTGTRHYKAINEKGLTHIFLKSKKADVEKFIVWIQNIVAPQIRQTGKYIPKQEEKILYLLDN